MKKITATLTFIFIFCYPAFNQIVINEIFACNNSSFLEKITFNFPGYIEIYNKGTKTENLSNYYLTDDINIPNKFKLPWILNISPKSYYLIYCDRDNSWNHTNFSLDADGGTIALYNTNLNLVDSVNYSKQYPDIVYGQSPDGSGSWTWLASPTPQATNNTSKSSNRICSNATILPQAGFYSSPVNVTINSSVTDGRTRYTTDGSEPTEKSSLYTSPFTITKSTVVKAKNFNNSYMPSYITCKTYLINEHSTNLPVVSVSINPLYLYDDSIGIYVIGKNGEERFCYGKANWNRDWSRSGYFEYFDQTGNLLLSQGTELKIAGACSRTSPQKSIALLPSSRYGSGSFDYPFFASRPYLTGYGSLMLRNSGNDWNTTMFRDALMQELCIHQFDIDYQAYQPTAVYINGKYFGLANLREKADKNYLRANRALLPDSMIMLERNAEVISGSNETYMAFIDTLNKVDMSTDAGFQLLDRNIDLNQFINYLVIEIYYENKDWPGNNYKFWKSLEPGSKWRWILTDLDFGMGLYGANPCDSTLNFVTATNGPDWPNPPWSTLLIRKVFENPTSRNMFIQKMQTALNTVFTETRVNAKIDSIKSIIAPEMVYHRQLYGSSVNEWNNNIEAMKTFNKSRNAFMAWHLKDFFKLYNSCPEVKFKDPIQGKASYWLNKCLINDTLPKEYFANLPVTIEARPLAGYAFDHWECTNYDAKKIELIATGSTWKYNDKSSNYPDISWKAADYDDSGWAEGLGEFGYGDGDETTITSYGPDVANKYITTCFRKRFVINDLNGITSFNGKIIYDDAAVVYLNGAEIFRNNIPEGQVYPSTLASTAREDDDMFFQFTIPANLLKSGENVIAVEIHQNTATSSDISFDLGLSVSYKTLIGNSIISEPLISGTFNNTMELTAIMKNADGLNGLFINEVSAANSIFHDNRGDLEDWIELYNGGTEEIPLENVFVQSKGDKVITWSLSTNKTKVAHPGSFVLLWADNELDEGNNHLPFKISAKGETVVLLQKIGEKFSILDTVTVVNKTQDASLGRYPDGDEKWYMMSAMTPGKNNEYSPLKVNNLNDQDYVTVFPNPSVNFTNIQVTKTGFRGFEATLIGIDGRCYRTIKSDNGNYSMDLSGLSKGTYILSIVTGKEKIVKKIIIVD